MASQLQADIISSKLNSLTPMQASMDIDLQLRNSQRHPVHVMDIDFLIEDAGREEDERKPITTKVQHSCIIRPRSSKIVKVPLSFTHARESTPYTMRANLNIRDAVHGMYQVSTEKIRQMFARGGEASKPSKVESMSHLDGRIEGLQVTTRYPDEAIVAFDLQVTNSNLLSLKLLHANFTVKSGDKIILKDKVVEKNLPIKSKSTEKLQIAFSIPLTQVRTAVHPHLDQGLQGGEIEVPAYIIPIVIDVDFWFREPFYGLYKIEAKKTGEIILPVEPEIKLQKVVFKHHDDLHKPVAELELRIYNHNPFDLDLKNVIYEVSSRETSSTIAEAVHKDITTTVKSQEAQVITATAVPSPLPSSRNFGSALLDVFKGGDTANQYVVQKVTVEADTKYGKIVFAK